MLCCVTQVFVSAAGVGITSEVERSVVVEGLEHNIHGEETLAVDDTQPVLCTKAC